MGVPGGCVCGDAVVAVSIGSYADRMPVQEEVLVSGADDEGTS